MIPGVIFEDLPKENYHEDERRTLTSVFNGDVPGFPCAEQVKFAHMKETRELGRHFHCYPELFYVLSGKATFTLQPPDIGNGYTFELVPGKRLLIPPRVFHSALVEAGTILCGLTQMKYISPKVNDHHT